MSENVLQKYYRRLATEGIIKALLWGVSIGCGFLAILGGLSWLFDWKSVWVCLLVSVVISAAATVVLYYWKFKPTTKYIARRVDDLGLHERMLTMTELEGDESYIAKRQREDALEKLATIKVDLLTIGVTTATIILSVGMFVFGMGAGTVAVLTEADIIPSGQELFNPDGPVGPVATYTVTYTVKGKGSIQGLTEQTLAAGEKTESVLAIPEDGWRFLKWTAQDEVQGVQPYRSDIVFANITYTAVFVELEFDDLKGLPEDKPDDAPGDGEEKGDGNSDDQNEQQEQNATYEEVNQIIDGQTYYGDQYNEAYKDALEDLADGKYTDDQQEIGSGYFDNIEKNKNEENN